MQMLLLLIVNSQNNTGETGSGGAIWLIESNATVKSCSLSENYSGFWEEQFDPILQI